MEYSYPGQDNLSAVKSDGTAIPAAIAKSGADVAGVTLGIATYYVPLSLSSDAPIGGQATVMGVHLKWVAAVAATITLEFSNFPKYRDPGKERGPVDVSDYDATVGNWQQWNPTTAGPDNVQVQGTGNSATAFTITAGGTNAGSAFINLSAFGARRMRLKIVATAGGLLRVGVSGKLGA